MRATLAYFEATEAEILRMEDQPAVVPTTPPAAPVRHTSTATSAPSAAPVNAPETKSKQTVAVGPEDGILLQCIERYIEEYSIGSDELKTVKHMLSEWRGYLVITDSMREKINRLDEIIVRKLKDNKQPAIGTNNGMIQLGNHIHNRL